MSDKSEPDFLGPRAGAWIETQQAAHMIAHEATLVVQQLWRSIGEFEPGEEAEAA